MFIQLKSVTLKCHAESHLGGLLISGLYGMMPSHTQGRGSWIEQKAHFVCGADYRGAT